MSGILGSTTKLIVGRGLSIGLGIVSAPILARLYLPEHFGVYGVLSATANWLAPFGCLGYYQAIPLADNRSEIRTLVAWCILSLLALTLLAWGGLFLAGDLLVNWLDKPAIRSWLWAVPLLFLLLTLTNINQNLLSRQDRFGSLAIADALNQNSSRLFTMLWGWLIGAGAMGLLVGNMTGACLGLALGLTLGIKTLLPQAGEARPRFTPWRETLVKHRQFPRMQMWNYLLQASSRSLPIIVITFFFGAEVVGFFHFARNIAGLPLQLLGTSLGQAFYPQAAAEYRERGVMSESIRQALKILAVTSVFPVLVLALLAPMLFDLVFGVRWHEAGVYAQILSPLILVSLNAALVATFLILGRADLSLKYTVLDMVVRLVAVMVGVWLDNARTVVLLFSLSGCLVTALMVGHGMHLGGVGWRQIVVPYLRESGRGLLLLWPATLAYWLGGWDWVSLGLLTLSTAAYAWWVYRGEPVLQAKVDEYLRTWRRPSQTAN